MINLKIRLKNKTFLISIVVATIAFIYQILSICGVTPSISQDIATNILMGAVNILSIFGIVVDPTTKGISDSEKVLSKDESD